MIYKSILILIVLSLAVPAAAAPMDGESPFLPVSLDVLSNGMRIIVRENEHFPTVSLNLWVGAGSKHDPEDASGLAHFFEHMLFQGTETREAGEMIDTIEGLGGSWNAATSLDTTFYFINLPSQHWEKAMELQADAALAANFPEEPMEIERDVIIEEIRTRASSPSSILLDSTLQTAFEGTPYARPILGTEEHVRQIDRDDMFEFKAEYYVPNNMTLVVSGDVDREEILAKAERLYGGEEPRRVTPVDPGELEPVDEIETVETELDVDTPRIAVGISGTALDHGQGAALEMAALILGTGQTSRLYQDLVETGLARDVSASFNGFEDVWIFLLQAQADAENMEEVEEYLQSAIVSLQEEPVAEEELERAQVMARASFAFSAETNADVGTLLGRFETSGSLQDGLNHILTLESATADDIRTAALQHLDSDAYIRSIIKPAQGGMD